MSDSQEQRVIGAERSLIQEVDRLLAHCRQSGRKEHRARIGKTLLEALKKDLEIAQEGLDRLNDAEHIERRSKFNAFVRENRDHWALDKMPGITQDKLHSLLKRAFYAGSNYERKKHEVISIGGDF